MDFIRCENGIDRLTHAYKQIGGWLNPEIYEVVNKMENMLDWNEVRLHIRLENNTLQSRPQKMVMTIHFIMKIIRRMMEESMTIRQSM